jgi:hypothetical protein
MSIQGTVLPASTALSTFNSSAWSSHSAGAVRTLWTISTHLLEDSSPKSFQSDLTSHHTLFEILMLHIGLLSSRNELKERLRENAEKYTRHGFSYNRLSPWRW